MSIKKGKSEALTFLDKLIGRPFTLGSFIEAIRLGEEMTQVDFAALLGVSKSYLCDIEKGRRVVSPIKAHEYANILGYSPSQFVRLAFQDQLKRLGMNYEVHFEKTKKAA